MVASRGYAATDTQKTLQHIGLLIECFESVAIELKAKFHLIGPLEQMLLLYKY